MPKALLDDKAILLDSGKLRLDSYIDLWDKIVSKLEKTFPVNADVTRRTITLGNRDSTTGWRKVNYSNSTVEGRLYPRGASFSYQGVGVYAREDAMFITADPCQIYDQLLTSNQKYYEVVTRQEHSVFDSVEFQELQCHEMPLWQAASSDAIWKTSPSDPRSRTKTWIDTYARDAQILKDDGSTQASWACIFADPPYPLALEFRGTSNMHGFYVVDRPTNSRPVMDVMTQAPCGYEESLPIKILTIDSLGVTGTALNWRMEAELRHVFETYPTGSLRSTSGSRGRPIHLGSTTLYETEVMLDYRRDTST